MRNFRSLLLGLLLVILYPLGWGEDVYYCVEELSYAISDSGSSGSYKLRNVTLGKFTLKYEPDLDRLAIKGDGYAGEGIWHMQCRACAPWTPYFEAVNAPYRLVLEGDRFFYAGAWSFSEVGSSGSEMKTGTCTKF